MAEMVVLHDIVGEDGKTIRERNLELQHDIPLNTLVECVDSEEPDSPGIRAYVVEHTRDCDGTPLYNLSLEPVERVKDTQEMRDDLYYDTEWPTLYYLARGRCEGMLWGPVGDESLQIVQYG